MAAVAALTVNVLAPLLPLNGQTTGQISDRFHVYFVPAGYVFAIWGVIYAGWIAFAVYQMMPAHRETPRLRSLGYVFALSCVFNAAWLFCWHYGYFGVSVLVMLMLLSLLMAAYVRLDVGRTDIGAVEMWSVDVPFSIYLGWISVATVANIADYLYFVGWEGFGIPAQFWAVAMIAVASLLGLAIAVTRRDWAYVLVLAWAFAGIAVKHADTITVAYAARAATALVLALAAWNIVRRWSAATPTNQRHPPYYGPRGTSR
ncbi:MAG: tryptophan-rich sensory protein [Deltaproteobacteria bacterium]